MDGSTAVASRCLYTISNAAATEMLLIEMVRYDLLTWLTAQSHSVYMLDAFHLIAYLFIAYRFVPTEVFSRFAWNL